jgi:non-canonical purine NTP pyrophosphatase (RdgB/HAM1 family)
MDDMIRQDRIRMKDIVYITGNQKKLENATTFLGKYDLSLTNQQVDVQEIQADNAVDVAIRKARDAFAIVNEPLFINDASWHIPALNGFPGPYMRYIVDWFNSDDLLALMINKEDRTIILRDTIVYKDATQEKVFTNDVTGTILMKPTEGDNGPFITKLISFEEDMRSLAQMNTVGFDDREAILWDEFGSWLQARLK